MSETTRLSEVPIGESATIRAIPGGARTMRLREMGLLPGTRVRLVRRAPLGDPIELSVHGAFLSLRRVEAEQIEVMLG